MPPIEDIPYYAERIDCYLGVDPGAQGGMALVWTGGQLLQSSANLSPHTQWDWIDQYEVDFAVLEQVTGYIPRKGGAAGYAHGGQPGSAMFSFGRSYGMLEAFLIAAGIPYTQIRPQVWQKYYGLSREKGMSDNKWKNVLKAKACSFFPEARVTLATADALLLALYGQRLKENKL